MLFHSVTDDMVYSDISVKRVLRELVPDVLQVTSVELTECNRPKMFGRSSVNINGTQFGSI